MVLDKNNVKLLILTDTATFLPGQHIVGTLMVEVLREIALTAVRIAAIGTETVFINVKKKDSVVTRSDSFTHFKHLTTLFGFSSDSGRRGDASLEPGIYKYPFDIEIPPGAPPTYFCRTSGGEAKIVYVLRATVDIPRGFDKTHDVSFCVLPTMPSQQYEQWRNAFNVLEMQGIENSGMEGGCSGEGKGKYHTKLTVSIKVPAAILLPPTTNGPIDTTTTTSTEKAFLDVYLSMKNNSRKACIHTVRVTLSQHHHLIAQGDSHDEIQKITTEDVHIRGGKLTPLASEECRVRLRLPDSTRQTSSMPPTFPLPTLDTPCIHTKNLITVSVPEIGVHAAVTMSNATVIEKAVDKDNIAPLVPLCYNFSDIRQEEKLGAE